MNSTGKIIGIAIAAFFVGLGSTYLIFHTGSSDVNADFNMMENAQHATGNGRNDEHKS